MLYLKCDAMPSIVVEWLKVVFPIVIRLTFSLRKCLHWWMLSKAVGRLYDG
jgi:hypothetical protein